VLYVIIKSLELRGERAGRDGQSRGELAIEQPTKPAIGV
jgi:hypothetical protein